VAFLFLSKRTKRHCEAQRVKLCVSMGCGNLIYKKLNTNIYISRLPRRGQAQTNASLLAMTFTFSTIQQYNNSTI
jgi:hypothetical protein